MSDSSPVGDLVAAVSDALRGDRTKLSDILAGVKQRTEERVRDALVPGAPDQHAAPPLPPPVALPLPQPGPDAEVVIRSRNGQRVRAAISPAVARRGDLSAIARVNEDNHRRAFTALGHQHTAIERLTRSHEELAKKVTAIEQQADQALIGLVQGFAGLEGRLRDVTTQAPAVVATTAPASVADARPPGPVPPLRALRRPRTLHQVREINALAMRAQIQSVTSVVNSVQAAAYGQKGSVLATNNLLLAGNQLLWSLIDPVLTRAGVLDATWAAAVAAFAPIGTLLTGQILLGDRQHVRFISGVAVFDGTTGQVLESLRGPVAEALWPTFQRRTDIPVTVTMLDRGAGDPNVIADVVNGVLRIRLVAAGGIAVRFPKVRAAWIVDTGADVG